jgi:perosamine synthetase
MDFIPVCEPFLNGNELKYITEAVQTGWISSTGKFVKEFEEKFAGYCGMKFGVAVCNGTVALHLALAALKIGKGDEVIIPNFTMIASAFSVCYTGAKPVYIDADIDTWNMNVDLIEEKINPRTKAIMPVHIFGNPCNMDKIIQIAKKYNLFIIEDAAESHGAEYKGKKAGSFSDISAFSFFANKNITTGEGGMVLTNDENLYKKSLYFKNLCFPPDAPRNYMHEDIGFNYRMSNLHAALGVAQVEKADEYRDMRTKNFEIYKKYLGNIEGIILQKDEKESLNVHWMNGIIIESEKFGRTRDEIVVLLKEKGIDTRLFFIGMDKQPSLIKYGCESNGIYPVTEKLAKNGFYLPSASSLKENQIEFICETLINLKK